MEKQIFRISCDQLSAAFSVEKHGVLLYSLRDKKAGKSFLTKAKPAFTLTVKDLESGEDTVLSSDSGWDNVNVLQAGNSLTLSVSGCRISPLIGVSLTVTNDGNRLLLDTVLTNNSGTHTLMQCDYPRLWFDSGKNNFFFFPYGCGEIMPTVNKDGYSSAQSYPSYGASMQYLAMYNKTTRRGIYYGLHDKAPAAKKLCFNRKAGDKQFCLHAFLPLSDIKSGHNSQRLCGTLVWQVFDGDWYDASMLYRDFIENEADYVSDYDTEGRKDLPDWAKKVNCWFNTRVTGNAPFADSVIEKVKEIGSSAAVHLYYWHEVPFDNDYPHYFPMKSIVKSEVEKLHAAGIKVMPYINGRLWDTRDRGMEDWQYSSVAKPYTTKMYDGTPYIETYSSKETDGSKVELAVMCPSTTLWQDKVEEIVLRLFDEGFDAVYVDQIAAAEAKPCCDPKHNHPSGGGTWWCAAYNTLLERIHRKMPADRMLTTECNSDPFLKYVGGYLSWLWVMNNQVPAFSAIFSDKVISFGTDFRALGNFGYGLTGDLDEGGARIFMAQSFLFGQQMGWMLPAVFETMPYHEFYIKLVRCREGLLEFFNAGRLLRPPVITSDKPQTVCKYCREAYGHHVEEDAVTGQIWQRNVDGRRVLLVTNTCLEAANAVVKSSLLPDGSYMPEGDVNTPVSIKDGALNITLPALSYIKLLF